MRMTIFKSLVVLTLGWEASSSAIAHSSLGTGSAHVCTLTTQHTVKCWGSNVQGQLGDGTKNPHSVASMVQNSPTHSLAVVSGTSHSCALNGDGSVKCWGLNKDGQVGDGTNQSYKTSLAAVSGLGPDTNAGQVRASAIASFGDHTCVIVSGGGVRCWGNNMNGQLGDGSSNNIRNTPTLVSGLTGAVAITAGEKHSCALKNGGQVWCWGNNANGQLGDNTTAQKMTPVQVTAITNAVAVAAGSYHTCAILGNASKDVYCWGKNEFGQVGNDTFGNNVPAPTKIDLASGATELALGGSHSCALMSDSTTKCWGKNESGQLGDNTKVARDLPVVASNIPLLRSISAGGSYTCGRRKADDATICWGSNLQGQLGNTLQSDSLLPVVVLSETGSGGYANGTSGVFSAGGYHSCVIRDDLTLQCWGDNSFGQLGSNGPPGTTPVVVPNLKNVTFVSAGSRYTCAIGAYNTIQGLYCWGDSSEGVLGNNNLGYDGGSTPQRVQLPTNVNATEIVAGEENACAIGTSSVDNVARLYCWGNNFAGQLGSVLIGQKSAMPNQIQDFTEVTSVAVGRRHVCAKGKYSPISQAPGLYCWGDNTFGQFGNGQFSAGGPTPTLAGSSPGMILVLASTNKVVAAAYHTCVATNGSVYCWGTNGAGQLGPAGTVGTNSNTPLQVTGLQNVNTLSTGALTGLGTTGYVCAIGSVNASSGLWCWGDNSTGQLGVVGANGPTPVLVQSFTTPIAVSAGDEHACAMASGQLYCWGSNYQGRLGSLGGGGPTPTAVSLDNALTVKSGSNHTCATNVENGVNKLYCFGYNAYGQLGRNDAGGSTPYPVTGLGNVTEYALGQSHTCALSNNQLYCFGDNTFGQLGRTGTGGYIPAPASLNGVTAVAANGLGNHTCAIAGGALYCFGFNPDGQLGRSGAGGPSTTQSVPLSGVVTAVSVGSNYTCAIANSAVYCWGNNAYGQLGYTGTGGSTPQQINGLPSVTGGAEKIATGLGHTCVVADDNKVYCWGNNSSGQLGKAGGNDSVPTPVLLMDNATAVTTGGEHTCAVNASALYCWGDNYAGQLGSFVPGQGSTSTPIFVPGVTPVQSLSAGSYHTCVVAGLTLYCWGDNGYGQLGVGALSQPTPVPVLGGSTATESLIYDVIFYEAGFGL